MYVFNTSPYDLLKSRGLDVVENNKLRRRIQEHYDISHPYFKDYVQRNYDLMEDFRNKYFTQIQVIKESEILPKHTRFKHIPFDLESLRKNKEIIGKIANKIG